MIAYDPKLAKLRLLAKKKEKGWEAIEKLETQARRDYERHWMMYVDACRDIRCCASCEESLDSCRCVVIAANGGSFNRVCYNNWIKRGTSLS